ncbi:hypothetical protein MMC22_001300 [Lobaria immixta]|nr:hypothetical protein [Lobaria immixta]
MSGVEIAGLVLGAMPIVYAALENYEQALDPFKAFARWRGDLGDLIRDLWFQHTSYDLSIQALLISITTDEEHDNMTNDLGSPLWKSGGKADALRGRLGIAYHAYMQTIERIHEISKELAENLNIEGADKISRQGLEAIVLANKPLKSHGIPEFHFRKRVKFTMRKQKAKELLMELKVCTERLDTYADKSERLQEPYKAEKRSKFKVSLQSIENNAARLYDVLSRTWCSTHSSHQAGLLLEQRLVKRQKQATNQQRKDAEECDIDCLGISLLQSPSPTKWFEGEIRLIETPSNCHQYSSAVQVVISAPPSTPSSQAQYLDPSQLQIVTNLCSVIKQSSHPWIGLCLDSKNHLRGVYPAQPRALTYIENSVSLAEMLLNGEESLSRKDVYYLSVTLSSSLLQLSHTPWLSQSWDKADIIFHRTTPDSTSCVDVKRPYLIREHISGNAGLIRQNPYPRNDCSKLLALGVLLMEISSSQPVENLRFEEDFGPNKEPNEMTNVQAVRRWIEEQMNKGTLTPAFYSAISHCLKCFVDPTANLQNLEFRRAVEEQVLAPLEQEMEIY